MDREHITDIPVTQERNKLPRASQHFLGRLKDEDKISAGTDLIRPSQQLQ